MLNNKKLNIIISLIIAVGLWVYVIGDTNPKDTRMFKGIPITFVNTQVLDENNLAVLSTSAEALDIAIYGTRTAINEATTSDITATVDIAEAIEGTNDLKINIKIPDNVELDEKSISKVSVAVEEKISKEVDIHVSYKGDFENDTEAITLETSLKTTTITGAKSLVERVMYADAQVDAKKVTSSLRTTKSKIVPVDKDGIEVEDVSVSNQTVKVTSALAKTKTVALNVPIVDNSEDNVDRKVSAPKYITIKGMGEEIDAIDTVNSQEIDITGIIENTTIEIIPILPEGVQISDRSQAMAAVIKVESVDSKTFSFTGEDIELLGLNDQLSATIDTEKIEIHITGKKTVIDQLKKGDFRLSVDLSELEAGSHRVVVKAECSKEYTKLTIKPIKIKVTIE